MINYVKPYARLIRIAGSDPTIEAGISAMKTIEWCARISHRSEEAQTEDSWKRFIHAVVLEKGDWSVVEHCNATVDMVVDIGITHEWVRHRLFSFTQESTRFVNYEKKMPPSFILPEGVGKDKVVNQDGSTALDAFEMVVKGIEWAYKGMIQAGLKPQIARSLFPNALASRIITTGNLRVWRHVFCMRTCKEAHPQMREVMIPLLAEFKEKIPLLYDDIVPESRQIDNMRLPQ